MQKPLRLKGDHRLFCEGEISVRPVRNYRLAILQRKSNHFLAQPTSPFSRCRLGKLLCRFWFGALGGFLPFILLFLFGCHFLVLGWCLSFHKVMFIFCPELGTRRTGYCTRSDRGMDKPNRA